MGGVEGVVGTGGGEGGVPGGGEGGVPGVKGLGGVGGVDGMAIPAAVRYNSRLVPATTITRITRDPNFWDNLAATPTRNPLIRGVIWDRLRQEAGMRTM